MKTTTKDFWVSDWFIDKVNCEASKIDGRIPFNGELVSNKKSTYHHNKITISFEVPEKKIEITESEFDEACSILNVRKYGDPLSIPPLCASDVIQAIKKKLFGKEN